MCPALGGGRLAAWVAVVVLAGVAGGCRSGIPWVVQSDVRPPPPSAWGVTGLPAPPPVVSAAATDPLTKPPERGEGSHGTTAQNPRHQYWTAAVIATETATVPPAGDAAGLWDAARTLAPLHLVVLGSREAGVDGMVNTGPGPGPDGVDPALGSSPTNVVLFPGPQMGSVPAPQRHACGEATMFFLAAAALRADEAGQVRWLREQVAALEPGRPLFLLLDEPIWLGSAAVWERLRGVLRSSAASAVHVIAAGAARFSWWVDDGVQFHTMGTSGAPVADPEHPVADGEVRALLWLAGGPDGESVRILDLAALRAPEVFSRRLQEERQTLRAACQASPVSASDGVTEVHCQNPTEAPLAFDAEWRFAGVAGRAEPQMLGFSLDPGQSLRQRFRLLVDDGVPLKFAAPRLVLTTRCRDGLGDPVPVRIELAPPVRMGGQVAVLGRKIVVDGSIGDWSCAGFPLNHSAQVVLARAAWQGPQALSGTFYVAETEGVLCFALAVQRQEGVDVGCSLLLDTRAGEGGEYGVSHSPVMVSVGPDGRLAIDAPQANAVAAVWRPTRAGGVLEVAIDARLFADGRIPDPVLADAVLTQFSASGEPVLSLCFSGDRNGPQSSALYGRFTRSAAGSVAAEPAEAAGVRK